MFFKFKKNEKYALISWYAFLTMICTGIAWVIIFNLGEVGNLLNKFFKIIAPFTYAFFIAYLCNPIMKLIERKVLKSKRISPKLKRSISIFITFIIVFSLITLFVLLIVPQVVSSYTDLQSQVGGYLASAQSWADNFVRNFPLFNGRYENLAEFLDVNEISTDLKNLISNSYSYIQKASNYVLEYAGKFVIEIKNLVMGLILSVYFLFSKEKLASQIKKFLSGMLNRRHYLNIINLSRFTHETFGGFITGKLLDSLIIALLTFIVLSICKMPFYPLISVIIGVTNVIPIFGPFIGAIPSAFIIFIAEPKKALWFILIIIIIQQIDGNIIGPKILGDSIGLSALWIVVSITVFGGLFGITGMLLGVPAFAVIYTLVKEFIEKRLRCKGAPTSTAFYMVDPPIRNFSENGLLIDKDQQNEKFESQPNENKNETEESVKPAQQNNTELYEEDTENKNKNSSDNDSKEKEV